MAFGKIKTDNWSQSGTPRLIMRSARKQMNLSIRDLAAKANYSPSYIGCAEKGTCDMSISCAKRIASILMVNNWWEIAERFTCKDTPNETRFVGDNGTVIVIKKTKDKVEGSDNEI